MYGEDAWALKGPADTLITKAVCPSQVSTVSHVLAAQVLAAALSPVEQEHDLLRGRCDMAAAAVPEHATPTSGP